MRRRASSPWRGRHTGRSRIAGLAVALTLGLGACTQDPGPAALTTAQAQAAYEPVLARVRDQLTRDLGWSWTVQSPAKDKSWGAGQCGYATDTLRTSAAVDSAEDLATARESVARALAGTAFREITAQLTGTGGWTTVVARDDRGARVDLSSKGFTELSVSVALESQSCATTKSSG